jgi:hypothetical protein
VSFYKVLEAEVDALRGVHRSVHQGINYRDVVEAYEDSAALGDARLARRAALDKA